MRTHSAVIAALLLAGLPAFSQTFQVSYGAGYGFNYPDSADLTIQAVLAEPASIVTPFNVWDVTSITGTWTSGYGATAGQTYQVTRSAGNDIFAFLGPKNSISSAIYDLEFYAGPYYVSINGLNFGNPPIEGEYVLTSDMQPSPNYPVDEIGGAYAVQGEYQAPSSHLTWCSSWAAQHL